MYRSSFHDSDEEFAGFDGDLNEYDIEGAEDEEYVVTTLFPSFDIDYLHSDDMLRGPIQELDLGSEDDDEEEELPAVKTKGQKSKQHERPSKIIPTGSDASSDEEDEDEEAPVTMANMEARSRALDAAAVREADLDAEEMRQAELVGEEEDDFADADMDADEEGEGDEEAFQLPTAEEREQEKKTGGPQVQVVQRRMRECVRILNNFRRLGAKGRYVVCYI